MPKRKERFDWFTVSEGSVHSSVAPCGWGACEGESCSLCFGQEAEKEGEKTKRQGETETEEDRVGQQVTPVIEFLKLNLTSKGCNSTSWEQAFHTGASGRLNIQSITPSDPDLPHLPLTLTTTHYVTGYVRLLHFAALAVLLLLTVFFVADITASSGCLPTI